jgi:hypothetical protein
MIMKEVLALAVRFNPKMIGYPEKISSKRLRL